MTADAMVNETLLQVWKESWREDGFGAFSLFDIEIGYQDRTYLMKIVIFYIIVTVLLCFNIL